KQLNLPLAAAFLRAEHTVFSKLLSPYLFELEPLAGAHGAECGTVMPSVLSMLRPPLSLFE
ncbi:MAG: hypothetical protein RSD93_06800, partial [Gordonibacter sp.]|uniref:hypothetical protein n=1 Tax=Gordonibacter sp. TaxID=1968902 RepID=UPI002FCC2D43